MGTGKSRIDLRESLQVDRPEETARDGVKLVSEQTAHKVLATSSTTTTITTTFFAATAAAAFALGKIFGSRHTAEL